MATLARTPALLLWLLALLAVPASLPAQVDAFSVEVAVADRSEPERRSAYASALRVVLLANSPDKTLMNRDEVRAGLAQADAYVQTYGYRVPEPGSAISADTPLTETVRTSGEATALLLVRFDRERVLALMAGELPDTPGTAAGVEGGAEGEADRIGERDPFAGAGSALVWLLIDEGSRSIRGSDTEAAKVRERLRELAGGAGLSLVFPQTDEANGVTAQGLLDSQAIRTFDERAVRQASSRYRADAVLVGYVSRRPGSGEPPLPGASPDAAPSDRAGSRVRRAPGAGRAPRAGTGGWQGEWARLAGPTAVERTRTDAVGLDEVLGGGIAWLVDDSALDRPADYAYGGDGSATEGLVRFAGIASLAGYTDVLALLEGLPGVERVYPKEASGDAMVFAILPRSALADVGDAAARAGWLRRGTVPLGDRVSDLARNAELSYDVLR